MPEDEPLPRGGDALRSLSEALGSTRARRPEDADDPDTPVAATVLILRDGADGPEVLMIERPDRGSFAGAWVFPGGKVDPGDAAGPDASEEDTARRAGIRETCEEAGLEFEPDELLTVSRWDPPPGLPLRIRTWFFAARATDAEPVLSVDEAVDSAWLRPVDALERHACGELTLYPPTWVTLRSLAGQRDVDALLGILRVAGVEHFETAARRGPTGPMMLWQGDAEYDPDAVAPGSGRHRLELGSLPWRYTRRS